MGQYLLESPYFQHDVLTSKLAKSHQVEVIAGLLREGVKWSVIERATGVAEAQFQALKQQVEDMKD